MAGSPAYCPLVVPDLGLPGVEIRASAWLASPGASVVEGDRLLELWAGEVTVDLSAPASGVLCAPRVVEDDVVRVGQVVGLILVEPSSRAASSPGPPGCERPDD